MRNVLIVALLAGVSGTAAAQFEVGAHAAVGQRWRDGGRRFHGGALSLGASTRETGVNIGVRLSTAGFPARGPDPNQACAGFCAIDETNYLLTVTQASAVLIPLRTGNAQLELGAGTSWTKNRSSRSQLALLLTGAAAYRVPANPMRLQFTYEKHRAPHYRSSEGAQGLFRHLVRVGLVYEGGRDRSR